MTLILTCLTDDCVYQVSDRRLTRFEAPRVPIDDESNKAVFVDGRVIFGYTGIAKVNGENTDLWLSRVVASANSVDMGIISEKIRYEATNAFRRMNFASRYKRHAFQAAGWFSVPGKTQLLPGTVTIHNALDSKTRDWTQYARPNFEIVSQFPPIGRAQFHLTSVGLTPTPGEKRAVWQLIRKCVHQRARRQEIMLNALVLSMRWLASQYQPDSPIGPNMMAVSLPKRAVEHLIETGEFMAIAGGPIAEKATFLYVNSNGRAEMFGPNVVYGGVMMAGFKMVPIVHAQTTGD